MTDVNEQWYLSRPWTKNYEKNGMKVESTLGGYRSLGDWFSDICAKYHDLNAATVILPNGFTATLRYSQLHNEILKFEAYLRATFKPQTGDRFAIMLPNSIEFEVALFGALRAGFAVVMINPAAKASEIKDFLNDSKARGVISYEWLESLHQLDYKALPVLERLITTDIFNYMKTPKRQLIRSLLWAKGLKNNRKSELPSLLNSVGKDTIAYQQLLTDGHRIMQESARNNYDGNIAISRDNEAVLMYTSGTTGKNKAAILTHGNILQMIDNGNQFIKMAVSKDPWKYQEQTATIIPMFHVFALGVNLLAYSNVGAHNLLIPNPEPIVNAKPLFQKFRPTAIGGVNLLYELLLKEKWFYNYVPKELKCSIGGGGIMLKDIQNKWKELTGSTLWAGYGMTEASSVVTAVCLNEASLGENVGYPLPGFDIKIVDDDGLAVAPGENGEIWYKGPQVFKRYNGLDEEYHNSVFEDGWFKTGDNGSMDTNGYLKITGRRKDMLKTDGYNVWPAEVEEKIKAFPGVREVAVIGVPHEMRGELACAFVVAEDGSTMDEKKMLNELSRTMSYYKVPVRIVFLQALPKNSMKKVVKGDLLKMVEN